MTTLEERVAQAIAFTLAINTDLPDWMQTPALGRDMLPLGELAAPAVASIVGEVLADLRTNLVKAMAEVDALTRYPAAQSRAFHERIGRMTGLSLALSYLDEAIREIER